MEIKIEDLCRHLEIMSSFDKKVKVEYFNGKKPENYFLPLVAANPLFMDFDKIKMAWFAEIFIDGKCIFRSVWSTSENNWELAEKIANEKLIKDIFCHGVMSSKIDMEKFYDRIKNKYHE